ncbi:MAG: hypothetical protein U9Q77_06165 [Candidatus Marinimicrobia bacterium]|nr:hypothetical protein [Candidatus Neomarinimicrobiota bacterium]
MKKLALLLLIFQGLLAQNVPFVTDHPVYHFLERQESLGHIHAEYWSTRPYTFNQINDMLAEIASNKEHLTLRDQSILKWYVKEFNREFTEDGITFPWSKSNLSGLRHPDTPGVKPFFMTYKSDNTQGWINWSETFRVQNNGKSTRGYYTDHLAIFGQKGSIDFTTQYDFHRITKNDEFTELPDNYKEGYILKRDYMEWINWGYPVSSLVYTPADFSLGIHRQPVYWGYSPANSPILSDNTAPLPHLQWTTEMAHLRFKFIHARLTPNESPVSDTLNIRRNLSAQRVEFDISPNFEFAFNEMVIYAYRDFELGYLNPVNFLFAEEHVQGDLDNKLMAIDFKWRVLPGLTSYGTWFFDELDFWKLFSGWWGNKFVFQLGATYFPVANLPSVNIEYTAARPWTYSHLNPVNSYTSAGRLLGLQDGPNTTRLSMSANWLFGPKLFIQAEINLLTRGNDPGADVLTSYTERGAFDEEDGNFLSGELETETRSSIAMNYYLSRTVQMNVAIMNGTLYEVGVKLDW